MIFGRTVLPDASTSFGNRVRQRLREDSIIWLTTVGRDGTPHPNPVWFLWEGEAFLIYNVASARRLRNVRDRPAVSLSFDGDGKGGDIVVIGGRAEIVEGHPPANEVPEFLAKYRGQMINMTPEQWSRHFSIALRVRQLKVRGHL